MHWSGPGFGSEVIPVDRFRIPDGTPNKQFAWVGYDVLGNLTAKGGLWMGAYGTQSASCPPGR